MLITAVAAIAAITIALAVWCVVPSTSRTRLESIFGTGPGHGDVLRSWLRRRPRSSEQELLAVALRSLSAELRAGATPLEALERAAGSPPLWPHALVAARLGERVDAGLILDASLRRGIADPLRQLAACWRVGVARGSGLAVSVERMGLSLRDQQELRATLRSELAAPRATARMLGLLPVIGIALGYLLGADPVAWFLGSSAGRAVAVMAVALTWVGTTWTRRIVRHVERGLH